MFENIVSMALLFKFMLLVQTKNTLVLFYKLERGAPSKITFDDFDGTSWSAGGQVRIWDIYWSFMIF